MSGYNMKTGNEIVANWCSKLDWTSQDEIVCAIDEAIQSAILAEREEILRGIESLRKIAANGNNDFQLDRVLFYLDRLVYMIRARSNAPETEKEIIVQMPPKSRQAGFFTINDYQTLDPGESIAPDPVSD